MKFNVSKVNVPHPQPGEYMSHGKSAQTIAFATTYEHGKSNNNSTSALSTPVVVRPKDMERSPSPVPTNNSHPLHTKISPKTVSLD